MIDYDLDQSLKTLCADRDAYLKKRLRARQLIESRSPIAYDVAASHGQIFSNVKHMDWFIDAVKDVL